jgi:hypothetical protein
MHHALTEHLLLAGFASTMMDPKHTVDPSERNKGLLDFMIPSHRAQWPGPLIFFCYGYNMSDYVKVDPERSDIIERGADAIMTELDIWYELHKLPWDLHGKNEPEKQDPRDKRRILKNLDPAAVQPDGLVWRWKVKEHGTSMEILDILHRDCNLVIDYLETSQLNPIPFTIPGSDPRVQVIHVTDLDHPAYTLKNFWHPPKDSPELDFFPLDSPNQVEHHSKTQDLRFFTLSLPSQPPNTAPMAGAFAVGLRWAVRYCMDINPPFRGNLPDVDLHGPLRDLLWTIKFPPSKPQANVTHLTLQLHSPGPFTDSVIVAQAENLPLPESHVKALLKYLNFTDPIH